MTRLLIIPALLIIGLTLWDTFKTMILPRRLEGSLRITRWFYRFTWDGWSSIGRRMGGDGRRETFLSVYGPMSLILLFAVWALFLIMGFALLYSAIEFQTQSGRGPEHFGTELYFSGTTFFTIGLGDISSVTTPGRIVTVVEGGFGFAFLALVIGYLPVLYQAFSRREVHISLLDARAGSPPTAGGLFQRYDPATQRAELFTQMETWEMWAAELLESHVSYPLLAYFRSQHDHQSWVAALTAMLDANAILIAIEPDMTGTPPQLAFAMARHAAVDLYQTFGYGEVPGTLERLPREDSGRVRAALGKAWPGGVAGDEAEARLKALRAGYEPYISGLAERLLMPLPPWLPTEGAEDDWETELRRARARVE